MINFWEKIIKASFTTRWSMKTYLLTSIEIRMTDETQDPDATPAKKSGSGGIVGLLGLAIAAAAGSFGVSYVMTTPPQDETACPSPGVMAGHIEPIAREDQDYVELEEILITIGSEPASRYLKMNLVIATDKSGTGAIEDAEPILRDAFINYLRSVELSDFEDPAFFARMREQLSRRADLVLGSAVSDGVLITEFLLR